MCYNYQLHYMYLLIFNIGIFQVKVREEGVELQSSSYFLEAMSDMDQCMKAHNNGGIAARFVEAMQMARVRVVQYSGVEQTQSCVHERTHQNSYKNGH